MVQTKERKCEKKWHGRKTGQRRERVGTQGRKAEGKVDGEEKGKRKLKRKEKKRKEGNPKEQDRVQGQNSAFWYRSSIYAHLPNFVQIGLFCHPAGA